MKTLAIKALAAASLSLLAVAPAAAEEVRVAVPFGDLDITTPAGAEALAARIEAGVETVCARPESRAMTAFAAWDACKANARAEAVAQLAEKGAAVEGTSLAAL